MSYYLASKSNRVARATYKLAVVNQIIGGNDEVFASSGVRVFEAKGVQVKGVSIFEHFLSLRISRWTDGVVISLC